MFFKIFTNNRNDKNNLTSVSKSINIIMSFGLITLNQYNDTMQNYAT